MMQRSPGLTVLFASVLGARNHMLDRGQRSARWSGRPSPAHGPRGPCAHTRDALAPRHLTLDPRPVGMSPRRPLGRAGSCRLSIGRTRAPQPGQAALSAQRVPPGARRCRGQGGSGLGGGPLPLGDWVFPASSRAFEETPEAPVGRTSSASQQPGVPAGLRGQGVQRASGVPQGDPWADSQVEAGVPGGLRAGAPGPGQWTGLRQRLEGRDLPGEGRRPPSVSTRKEGPSWWERRARRSPVDCGSRGAVPSPSRVLSRC